MFRKPVSPHRAPSFRFRLEPLEDRTLLSQVGDLLISFGNDALGKIANAEAQIVKVNLDEAFFNANPSASNLVQLAADAGTLLGLAQTVETEVSVFSASVTAAKAAAGLGNIPPLSSFETSVLNAAVQGANAVSSQLLSAGVDAISSAFAAAFVLESGNGGANLKPVKTVTPTPTPPPNSTPTPTPTGPVSENIDKAPSTWPSDAKIGPAESVTVTNTSNSPVTVKVSFQGDDGSFTSNTDVCTNNTITVADGGAVLPPGHSGTFTVSVTGQPDQTNTVNYQ
jgi:hypothetical protein